jgi:TolB-like protein
MKKNSMAFVCMCLVSCMMAFSCATTGGDETDLSLEEAIEQSADEIAGKLPAKTRIAVVSFTTEHPSLSVYIMDELALALAGGSLEVTDRQRLELVKREQGFQLSGDVSDETAVSIGKILGAGYVITGQLVKAGGRYRYRVSGINVETAALESPVRLNVRDDRSFQTLLADLRQSPVASVAADYGKSVQPAQTPITVPTTQPTPTTRPVTPPAIITDTAYVDSIGLLTYSLSNSLDDIEKAIFTRTGKNIKLINIVWQLNTTVLSPNVKALMNKNNANYSMTAYGRHITVNKRENNQWYYYRYDY